MFIEDCFIIDKNLGITQMSQVNAYTVVYHTIEGYSAIKRNTF